MKLSQHYSVNSSNQKKAGHIYEASEEVELDALPPSLRGKLYDLPPIKRDICRSLPEPVRDLLEEQYGYMKYDVQSDSICISES